MKTEVFRVTKGIWYDAGGTGYPVAAGQIVSYATAAQVATANTAGIRGTTGDIVCRPPVTGGLATAQVLGVTLAAAKENAEVSICILGIIGVMMNAAVAAFATISPAANATRTTAQTPFTNNPDLVLPMDPSVTLTYCLQLGDDTALPADKTAFYPLGYALEAAAAQYEIVPVEINTTMIQISA